MPSSPPWAVSFAATRDSLRGFRQIPPSVRDELAQEALTRVWCMEAEVQAPMALLRRVAHNLAIDWLRRRREEALPERERGSGRWLRQTHARLDVQRVARLMEQAPVAYRDIVQRCFLDEEDVASLIAEEQRPGEARHRVQDRIYKRRARGLAWVRLRLEAS